MDIKERYDVIVIGAGLGGLTCGALLAKNGFNTLVLDQHTAPGGYCTSFKRKGFIFDAAVHFLEGVGYGGSLYNVLGELEIENELEYHRMDPLYKVVYPDESISIPADLNEYIALLSSKFPTEKQGITKLFDTIEKLMMELSRLPLSLKIWDLALFPLKFPLIYKYNNKTFAEMMADFIADRKLKSIISAAWGCVGLPPSRVSALEMCGLLHVAHTEGFYYPKGGSQAFADLLVRALTKHGGVVQTRTKATKIVIENNRVTGVEVSSGERVGAKYVVSNVDARQTFYNLIGQEKLNKKFVERLNKMEPSGSFFQVWLGVDMDPREKGINETETFYHSSYDTDGLFSSSLTPKFEEGLGICIPTLADPGLAPEGKHIINIGYLPPYNYDRQRQLVENKTGEEYRQWKEEARNQLVRTAEKLIPGLSDHIVVSEAATPQTLERYTLNYKGAAYGWAHSPNQVGKNRLQPVTPIKGLYLAGHWTTPGGGTMTVILSGKTTAEIIIKGQ